MDPGNVQKSAQKAVDKLKHYFSQDNRFIYLEPVGAGTYGSAHHVRYRQPNNGPNSMTDFLVKTAHENQSAEISLQEERRHLQRLRGAAHIVQLVNIPDDPLARNNFQGKWLMLEWVPNGTLEAFIRKTNAKNIRHLPNRLLYRFFLCLVRACCGMAWPRNRQDGSTETETPKESAPEGFIHNDLHAGNVVLGEFLHDSDHIITPILKLIDFGGAGSVPDDVPASLEQNIWDVGNLMIRLITLDLKKGDTRNSVTINIAGHMVRTRATNILPRSIGEPSPLPWLEPRLAELVALCMADDARDQPNLQNLTNFLTQELRNGNTRPSGTLEESDNRIQQLCRDIILSPSR